MDSSRPRLPIVLVVQFALVLASCALLFAAAALACLTVEDDPQLAISKAALEQLKHVGFGRAEIFETARNLAAVESEGCWGGATGNFDEQRLSVGIAQFNVGRSTLQPLLKDYQSKLGARFDDTLAARMPLYGKKLFSRACLAQTADGTFKPQRECYDFLESVQTNHKLDSMFKQEIDALFETRDMRQVQLDELVKRMTSVVDDIKRLFPRRAATYRDMMWAVDMKVQQGDVPGKERTFPDDKDILRVRTKYEQLTEQQRTTELLNILHWYDGLCRFVDQDGVRYDCDYNKQKWEKRITLGVAPEQQDLLLLTHLRSRVARTKAGLYQADCFQRRARIILGVGSVHGTH